MGFQFLVGENVDQLDWDQESYPQYEDLIVLPFFIIFFPLLRLVLDRLIFEKLAKWLIFGKDKDFTKLKSSSTRTKIIRLKLKLLYMYCRGHYIYAIFAVIFWDIRRSDFMALLLTMFGRVGAVVLAQHEGSDVFLETAKISKYSGLNKLSSTLFFLFALSWWILRIICFPFWILRSTSYEMPSNLRKDNNALERHSLLLVQLFAFRLAWFALVLGENTAQDGRGTDQSKRTDWQRSAIRF